MPRAGRTALVPVRIEHEVIDDQLPPAFKKGLEILFAVQPVEDIVLASPHHWQALALRIDAIAVFGQFLFTYQKLLPPHQPLVSRYHWRMRDWVCNHL